MSAYTLTFAVLLMFGAALGDRFGRRRLFLIGITVFTGASAAAAMAPGIESLIAARAVQGVGAAIMMPLTLTLLTAAVPAAKRGMAYGIWGAVNGLAVASGPLIGGSLTEHISWHWIFWLNVPLGLALIPLARLRLSESHGTGAPLDFPGTLLASSGLFGIVYGLVRGPADGWTSSFVLTGLFVNSALFAGFVIYSVNAKNPMLPMRLFRSRAFSGINAASLLMFLGMFGSIFLLSQYMQGVLGYSPTEAGLRMLPWTGMPMIVAPIAGILSDRIGGRPVVAAGLFLQAAGLGFMSYVVTTDVSYTAQLPGLILSGIGMALFFALSLQPGHVQRPSPGAGHRLRRQQRAPRGRRRARHRRHGVDLLLPRRLPDRTDLRRRPEARPGHRRGGGRPRRSRDPVHPDTAPGGTARGGGVLGVR